MVYTPDKFVAVHESLLLWKGQLVFKHYIPLKQARFGIKLFNVCEDTGYTYKFHIYTGKEDPGFQIEDQISPEATHLTATEKNCGFHDEQSAGPGIHWFQTVSIHDAKKNCAVGQ